jgi:formylglycine-generating enzyme required for sulfatase activity
MQVGIGVKTRLMQIMKFFPLPCGQRYLHAVILIVISCAAVVTPYAAATSPALINFNDCDVCSEMTILPSGEYTMGATHEEFNGKYEYMYIDETPQHKVFVKRFGMAKFDVTKEQFGRFAKETGFDGKGCLIFNGKTWKFDRNASWQNPGFQQSKNEPVVCVSWNDAQRFVVWLNSKLPLKLARTYRLPTETEWEYAARSRSRCVNILGWKRVEYL